MKREKWIISVDGMDGGGYWIEAARYNEIARHVGPWCSDWLVHIAGKSGKSWDLEKFIAAFEYAMTMARIKPLFDWDRSVEYARQQRASSDEFNQVWDELYPPSNEIVALPYHQLHEQCEAVSAEIRRRAEADLQRIK